MHPRQASVMLVVREDGKLLGVTRKDELTKFGFPGGGLEPNETPEQAAIRETFEETGISVHTCVLVFEELVPVTKKTGLDLYVYYFKATDWSGEINTTEAAKVEWVTPDDILNGCYPNTNGKFLRHAGIIK